VTAEDQAAARSCRLPPERSYGGLIGVVPCGATG
jgi:hypothetical protein